MFGTSTCRCETLSGWWGVSEANHGDVGFRLADGSLSGAWAELVAAAREAA